MDSSKLSNWLQIVGNVGLIAGLVLVAAQINQNNQLTRAQIVSDGLIHVVSYYQSLMGENPAATLARARAGEELTDEDLEILDAALTARFSSMTRAEIMDGFGFTAVPARTRGRSFAVQFLGNPAASAWWEKTGRPSGAIRGRGGIPMTREAINEFLDERGPEHTRQDKQFYEDWRSAIEGVQG